MTSPGAIRDPSMIWAFSTTPTMTPQVILPRLVQVGHLRRLAAMSAHPASRQAFASPDATSTRTWGTTFPWRCSRGRKSGAAPCTRMSLTQWFTMSWPIVV